MNPPPVQMKQAMRCWIAVTLPLLPLQSLHPRWCEPRPLAIIDDGQVVTLNRLAAEQGVRAGMRRASAEAIAPGVPLQPRDLQREQQSIDAVALTLMQYTPEIAIDGQDLLLNVSASLSLFGGPLHLSRRVRDSVQALGLSVRLGMAPTAQAAAWFARHTGRRHRRLTLASMQRLLDTLPFTLLPMAARDTDWLDSIGCRTLADLRRLPRTGLRRRTQAGLLDKLDRAYAEAPELFDWLSAPDNFEAAIELPYRIDQAPSLLFGAQRLVLQLTGWLVARQQAVACLVLWLEHERGRTRRAPTALEIVLAEPSWQEAHLLRLLKERLERLPLPAPVIALRLEASRLTRWTAPSGQLFPEPGGTPADYRRLLELLTARLGPQAVQQPVGCADYRPEVANQWQYAQDAGVNDGGPMPSAARPFWLLEKPLPLSVREHRPFYGSPLRLLSGPERIETGWWDGALALRDYFVAQGEEGACYWIYRERDAASARWFLQGLFG